jgi:hypothetical protein
LQDLAVLVENVYNIDKIGVIILILSLVKVLVGKDNI